MAQKWFGICWCYSHAANMSVVRGEVRSTPINNFSLRSLSHSLGIYATQSTTASIKLSHQEREMCTPFIQSLCLSHSTPFPRNFPQNEASVLITFPLIRMPTSHTTKTDIPPSTSHTILLEDRKGKKFSSFSFLNSVFFFLFLKQKQPACLPAYFMALIVSPACHAFGENNLCTRENLSLSFCVEAFHSFVPPSF